MSLGTLKIMWFTSFQKECMAPTLTTYVMEWYVKAKFFIIHHIRSHIKFRNREWQRRDGARFRGTEGTWDIGVILNNGKAIFSAVWSRFMKEQKVKENDTLLFTLREDDDIVVFDVVVNLIN